MTMRTDASRLSLATRSDLYHRGAGHGVGRDLDRSAASRHGAGDSAVAGSAPRCARRWTRVSIISSRKVSRGGRASGSIFARDLLATLRRRELDEACRETLR